MQPTNDPLLVYLPPFPSQHAVSSPLLPSFLHKHPVATINYRWSPFSQPEVGEKTGSTPLHWPTPVHDTSFAFAWLLESLPPPTSGRRDIYVFGSYLGAGLAASLALTEAHSHSRFGVRGFIGHNGIYNWTMFLPDHRINKVPRRGKSALPPPGPAEGSHIHRLQERMPALFDKPENLFDPFASPSLFFHSPGLIVPQSFFMTVEHSALIDNMTSDDEIPPVAIKAPRKSHLVYPPRQSTLKVPDALLLFDSAPITETKSSTRTKGGRLAKRARASGNSFETQAAELVELMRRSVNVVELKDRSRWDDDLDMQAVEAAKRIQVVSAGFEGQTTDLSEGGKDAVASWLECRRY